MLEPIRQYAQQKLEASGEAKETRRRHAEFFLELTEEAESELVGPGQIEWFARLDAELGNIRAALSWSLEYDETGLALRLAGALWAYWFGRGYFGEGRRWLEASLAVEAPGSVAARVKSLDALGRLANWQGEMDRVEAAVQEGLRLSAGAEVEVRVVASLREAMGDVARVREDYERAEEWCQEGLALCRDAGDKWISIWILGGMTNLALEQNDYRRAEEIFEEAIALARELGDALALGTFLNGLSFVYVLRGDYPRATTMCEEAVALLRSRGYKGILVNVISTLAWALLQGGNRDRAVSLHREGLALCKDQDDRTNAAAYLEGLACEAATAGEARRTATLFGQAQALREAGDFQLLTGEREMHEPYIRAARSQLDGVSWEAAFAEGRAMTFEDAVAFALSEEGSAKPSQPGQDRFLSEPQPLTRREKEVASLVARGLTNQRIASELTISEHTVHHHVTNILKKLKLSSREQVASRLQDR